MKMRQFPKVHLRKLVVSLHEDFTKYRPGFDSSIAMQNLAGYDLGIIDGVLTWR